MYYIIYSSKLSLLQARYLYLSSGLTIFYQVFLKSMSLNFNSIHYTCKSVLERFLRIYFTIDELNVYFNGRPEEWLKRYGEKNPCISILTEEFSIKREGEETYTLAGI